MKKMTLFLLLLVSLPLSAQDARVRLVPVSIPETPGAGGSFWVSEHYFHNQGDEPILVTNVVVCNLSAVHACDARLPPHSTTKIALPDNRPIDVWTVTEGDPADFSVTSFVRNVAADVDPWGTLIPTPRSSTFFAEGFHITPVPASTEYRVSLRVYAVPSVPLETVTVEIWKYPDFPSVPIVMQHVETLTLPRQSFPLWELYGSYFEAHDLLRNVELGEDSDSARVWIRVHAPGANLWGMASLTHNVTHHVTIFTP
jgi:hypothetical protein